TPTPPPPAPPPSAPANLSAAASCSGSQPQIVFNWTDATGETGYFLDVNAAAWTGPGSPSPWGFKPLGANVTSFTWSAAAPLLNGPPTTPAANTTYWWRLIAVNGSGSSPHVYPANSFSPPGVSVTTADCGLDLKARFVNNNPPQIYQPNQTANLTVRVTNIGATASAATTLGLWPNTSGMANCPSSPSTPPAGQSYAVGALAPGASVDVPVSFNVGSNPGTFIANAYVIPLCNQADRYWPNNATNGTVWVGPNGVDDPPPGSGGGDDDVDGPGTLPGGFTYAVDVNAWFETVGGDVGSTNDITVDQTAATGRYNSAYLLAAKTLDSQLTTQAGWRLNNYTRPLVPTGGIYNYLAERFRQRAISEGHSTCTISAGVLPEGKVFGYCNADASFNVGNGPNGNQVWFIDGNLTISKNLILGATDTATFVVKGNITVESSVTRIDGIYIAGGTFNGGNVNGAQLLVNGSVYAGSAQLGRTLAASGCGVSPCDNAVHPAERIVFDLKYLVGLNSVLASPSISWKEVAP
ncbi:MAG: hypothetical protein AAB541_03780, partial [Patescibacteria group bacterium]